MIHRAMPSSDLLIIGVTPRRTTASIQDPSWKCETEGCLDPVFVDGYIEGNQYRHVVTQPRTELLVLGGGYIG